MKREKIIARLRRAAEERLICSVYMKGKTYYVNCWPLLVSDELLVCAHDSDFILNGYGAYAIDRIRRVVIKDDICTEFSRKEGLIEQIVVPEIDGSSWQTLFSTLPKEQLTGVERANEPKDEAYFVVGRIVKVGRKRLHMLHIKPDAVWEDRTWSIRYSDIREVTFADRYLSVFGKYAGGPPQAGGEDEA